MMTDAPTTGPTTGAMTGPMTGPMTGATAGAMTGATAGPAAPVWFRTAAALGLVWNAYGVLQFQGSLVATAETLMTGGMTAAQAAVMTGYPAWMTLAFAIGVFGGLAGSGLLLARRAMALPVLAVSLAAYVALYIGDITQGVFAAMGASQVIVLTLVVLIAAGLVLLARHGRARAILR